MPATNPSFINCATFLDLETAADVDREHGSSVQQILGNIHTYHMEYDPHTVRVLPCEKLPRCFFRDFGDLIDEYVVLEDPNKNEIEVQIVNRSNELYFVRGWSRIKDVYNLCFSTWFDFVYVNPKLLRISLRTRSGCEVQYPAGDPPLKYMLTRISGDARQSSSAVSNLSNCYVTPRSFVRSYLKALTSYDVNSGFLILPWYQFGQTAFAFTFSKLVLVDHAGCRYPCHINFGVDRSGELACKVWGGWASFCRRHRLTEGDRIRFAVTEPERSCALYVCVYPQIGIETTLSYPLSDGSYLPLYISQQYFVANC